MCFFYGPRAPEAKPASMASASKCESNIFRRPLVLAPAAVPAGSSFDSPGGASMAPGDGSNFCLDTAILPVLKMRAARLDFWDDFIFVLDKQKL